MTSSPSTATSSASRPAPASFAPTRRSTARERSHLTYEQVYKGVPVFGGLVRVHLDAARRPDGDQRRFIPGFDLDTARGSAAQAAERAIATVVADPPTDNLGNEAATAGAPSGVDRTARLPGRARPGRHGHERTRVRGGRDERAERARDRLRQRAMWARSSTATRWSRRAVPRVCSSRTRATRSGWKARRSPVR